MLPAQSYFLGYGTPSPSGSGFLALGPSVRYAEPCRPGLREPPSNYPWAGNIKSLLIYTDFISKNI